MADRHPGQAPSGIPNGSSAASPPGWPERAKALGEDELPVIRLHDLRHTHATLPLADGIPVKVVSKRLGHHQHVHPGMGRQAPTASL